MLSYSSSVEAISVKRGKKHTDWGRKKNNVVIRQLKVLTP